MIELLLNKIEGGAWQFMSLIVLIFYSLVVNVRKQKVSVNILHEIKKQIIKLESRLDKVEVVLENIREEIDLQRLAREFKVELELNVKKILDYNAVADNSELRTWLLSGSHEAAKYAERLILQGLKNVDINLIHSELKGILKDLRSLVNRQALGLDDAQMLYIEENIVKPQLNNFLYEFARIKSELDNSELLNAFKEAYMKMIQNIAIQTVIFVKSQKNSNYGS